MRSGNGIGRAIAALGIATSAAAMIAAAPAEDLRTRGAYLVTTIAGCGNCHTPRDAAGRPAANMTLAGGLEFDIPPAHVVAPNITPDPQTGIGKWSEAQIKHAITAGIRPDGTKLVRTMAFDWYAKIAPADLDAIVAYLRSLKPAK